MNSYTRQSVLSFHVLDGSRAEKLPQGVAGTDLRCRGWNVRAGRLCLKMDGNPVRTHNGTTRLSSTQQKVTSLYKGRCLPWHHVPRTHCPLDSPFSLRCRPSLVPPPSQSTLSPNSLSSPCQVALHKSRGTWLPSLVGCQGGQGLP